MLIIRDAQMQRLAIQRMAQRLIGFCDDQVDWPSPVGTEDIRQAVRLHMPAIIAAGMTSEADVAAVMILLLCAPDESARGDVWRIVRDTGRSAQERRFEIYRVLDLGGVMPFGLLQATPSSLHQRAVQRRAGQRVSGTDACPASVPTVSIDELG